MITYEDIKNANDAIKNTDIKGKDYAEVHQRIKAFRMVYPTGTIETVMFSNEGGVCVFKATVGFYDENGNFITLGTGTAYEKENSSFINKTSYIENCETSACGRALGMAGFGIDTSVASAEEVQNAMANQNNDKKPSKEDLTKWLAAIDAECDRTGLTRNQIYKQVSIKGEADITLDVFNKIMRGFEKTPDKVADENNVQN